MAYNSARYLGEIAHPFRSRQRVLLIVRAYLDDTGTDANSRIAGVVGWMASTESWELWEDIWRGFLKENGLKKGWKQSEFGSSHSGRHCRYLDWSEATWLLARRRVWEILTGSGLSGVGCAVVKSDYEEIVAQGEYDLPPNPYAFCLDRCLSVILHRSSNLPHGGEGIAIYCDQDKGQEEMGQALATWHTRYVTLYRDVGYRAVRTTTIYGSRMDLIPLQAADIVATETGRACRAFLDGCTREEIDRRYPIIRELRDRECLSDVFAYSKAEIIAEFERGAPSPVRYGEKL